MRAMIVDDSRAMRMILRRLLGECGFNDFVDATSGREALDRLADGPVPAAAFVDWDLPGMTGVELVETVRAVRSYDGMRIVVITAECGADQLRRALGAGVDECVTKPFTKEMLHEKLALLLASSG